MRSSKHLLEIRRQHGATTTWTHVRSHTGGTDILSRGNALADQAADEAAENPAYLPSQTQPFLTNEDNLIFWVRHSPGATPTHVIGNIRPVLKQRMAKAQLAALCKHPKQGEVARVVGMALPTRFQLLRQGQHTQLFLFLLKAAAQLLPTPDAILRRNEDRLRNKLLCRACNRLCIASSRHALACPAITSLQLRLHKPVRDLLHQLVAPAIHSTLPEDQRVLIRALPNNLHWYKPYRPAKPSQIPPPRECPADDHASHQTLLNKANAYDRYCGVLGFLPPAIINLAYPPAFWDTLPDHAYKATRLHIDKTLHAIQRHLLVAARKTFTQWLRQHEEASL